MALALQQRRFFAALSSTIGIIFLVVIASCGGGGGDGTPTPSVPSTRGWGAAQDISSYSTSDSTTLPQIDMDDAGNAAAVWHETLGAYKRIQANYFDGSSWGTANLLNNTALGDLAAQPRVAMDGSGSAVAIYPHLYEDGHYYIYANHFTGTAWSPPHLVQTYTGSAFAPDVAMNASSGSPIAVWHQYVAQGGGDSTCIYANQFNGGAWNTAELISTCSANNYTHLPRIARGGAGKAMAVWQQRVGAGLTTIWANYFNGAAWGTAARIENIYVYNAHAPQIAMNAFGQAMAIWRLSTGTGESIRANHFNGTAWGAEATAIDFVIGDASNPRVAMDATGNAIAVWEQLDGNGNYFIGANYFDGAAWGEPVRISDLDHLDAYDARYPQIAIDGSGNAMAVWRASYRDENVVFVNSFNGTSWDTAPRSIGFSSPGTHGPHIAMNGSGKAIAVWYHGGFIQASHFE